MLKVIKFVAILGELDFDVPRDECDWYDRDRAWACHTPKHLGLMRLSRGAAAEPPDFLVDTNASDLNTPVDSQLSTLVIYARFPSAPSHSGDSTTSASDRRPLMRRGP
jgi:hypothetical protein